MQEQPRKDKPSDSDSEFVGALKKGVLIGLASLVVIVPVVRMHQSRAPQQQVAVDTPPAQAPQQPPQAAQTPPPVPGIRLADFSGIEPSHDARLMANWVLNTNNSQGRAFVLVDKKDARVYVFSPGGKLQRSAPALLGKWRGDDSAPGIGDKPLSAVKEDEKTTPAGRFVAQVGRNAGGEDVVWVSYDLAVSMHRVRPLVAAEHRLERLASRAIDDNRISFGCINLPVSFYEDTLKPTVDRYGAVVYVMPDVKSLQEVFGAYDVEAMAQQADAPAAAGMQEVALHPAPAPLQARP